MSSFYEKLDNRIETFLRTLQRFPLASFSAFLLTIILLVLINYHNYDSPNAIMAAKIAFVASLGVLLFPALQLLGRSVLLPLIGLVLLTLYYYILPANLENMEFNIGLRHLLLAIALFFMIFWAPFIFRKSDNPTFWQYAQSIIFGLITSIFFTALIYTGLATALYAVEKLFNITIDSVRYGQLAIVIAGIFGVNFFLSQIPKHPLFMQVRPYSKIKRIFSKNLLAPIAIIYFVILFAYTAKILIDMEWPTGTLSWIIVAFSLVAIVSFLFLTPYLKKSTLTQRLIWLAIFLQTIMLGMALWMRIEEYGMTYNRYLLAMFGLWLVLMSLYFMLFGKAQQKWLFFFISLLIVIAQFGPYSATAVTQKSQTQRLVKLLETAQPISEELEMKKKYEISNSLTYIEKHYGIAPFESIIPNVVKKYREEQTKRYKEKALSAKRYTYNYFPQFATNELGFNFISDWEWRNYLHNGNRGIREHYYFYLKDPERSINIDGYKQLINYHYRTYLHKHDQQSEMQKQHHDLNLSILLTNKQLEVQIKDHNLTRFNLSNYLNELMKNNHKNATLSQEKLMYAAEENNLSIKLLFNRLTLTHDGNISDFNSQILLNY